MAGAISDTGKKRGRPKTDATGVHVKLLPGQLESIDSWAAAQTDKPSRPEAIRRLVELGLKVRQ